MQLFNALGAVREGQEFVQNTIDQHVRRQAGNALAQGDYRGGANALLGGGMLEEGQGLLNYDQRNQQAEAESEKAAKVERAQLILRGAQTLRQVPEDQRPAAFQAQIMPIFAQAGLDKTPEGQQIIAHAMQGGMTDQQLDSFIQMYGGELQKPEWQVVATGNGGVMAVDKANPGNRQTISEPRAQQARVIEAQDGLWQENADGTWTKVATFAAQAKNFAPKAGGRGRARGQGGGRAGGSPELPSGFVLE